MKEFNTLTLSKPTIIEILLDAACTKFNIDRDSVKDASLNYSDTFTVTFNADTGYEVEEANEDER